MEIREGDHHHGPGCGYPFSSYIRTGNVLLSGLFLLAVGAWTRDASVWVRVSVFLTRYFFLLVRNLILGCFAKLPQLKSSESAFYFVPVSKLHG